MIAIKEKDLKVNSRYGIKCFVTGKSKSIRNKTSINLRVDAKPAERLRGEKINHLMFNHTLKPGEDLTAFSQAVWVVQPQPGRDDLSDKLLPYKDQV